MFKLEINIDGKDRQETTVSGSVQATDIWDDIFE